MTAAEPNPFQNIETLGPSVPELLWYVLENLAAEVGADAACVYTFSPEIHQADLLVAVPCEPGETIRYIIETQIAADTPVVHLNADALTGTAFRSGLAWRVGDAHQTVGALVILSHASQINIPVNHTPARYCLGVARALLQNQRLQEDAIIAQTIRAVTARMSESPTPQDMVNMVSDHLLSPGVRFCGLLLYGPQHEDQPNGPFSYLELQGTWSHQYGTGVGLGVRLYLDQYTDLLAELDSRKVWHIRDVSVIASRFDGLIRAFIKGARIHSAVMMNLDAGHRKLGLLVIGTQDAIDFTQQELRAWQSVSEFLAMSTMARVLQQQHDFMQRARAALLDSVTDGVLMVLPSANHLSSEGSSVHVLTVNPCFSAMFNLSQTSAQGLSLLQLLQRMQLPEDVRQQLARDWLSVPVRDPATQRSEFNMVHPRGSPIIIEWYSAPLYQDQRVMGRIYIFHDVTEDRSAVSLRANFISRMSHELRTPLTSIKGFAQFMVEELGDQLSPLAREYAEIIFANARHLNNLFTDIIEITRADTGDMTLNFAEASLPELFENVALRFKTHGVSSRKWIALDMAQSLPFVQMDANRISQVLDQLVSNAFKHAPPDSAIHILARLITSAQQLPAGAPGDIVLPCVLITVLDEGAGLSQEEVEPIFLPFYRTQEARTARLEGTGLGLTTARSIVKLHRGKIWAEGRKRGRRGGRFHFTLPTAEG